MRTNSKLKFTSPNNHANPFARWNCVISIVPNLSTIVLHELKVC